MISFLALLLGFQFEMSNRLADIVRVQEMELNPGPANVWTTMAMVDSIENDTFIRVRDCVDVKWPLQRVADKPQTFERPFLLDNLGVLRLRRISASGDCRQSPTLSSIELPWIMSLKAQFKTNQLVLGMTLWNSEGRRRHDIDIRIPDVVFPTGLRILPARDVSHSHRERPKRHLGEWGDRYQDKRAIMCSGEQCDLCRYGSYATSTLQRFCGSSTCGEQGEPACPRTLMKERCVEDATKGICQNGLRVVCDGNGILVCL